MKKKTYFHTHQSPHNNYPFKEQCIIHTLFDWNISRVESSDERGLRKRVLQGEQFIFGDRLRTSFEHGLRADRRQICAARVSQGQLFRNDEKKIKIASIYYAKRRNVCGRSRGGAVSSGAVPVMFNGAVFKCVLSLECIWRFNKMHIESIGSRLKYEYFWRWHLKWIRPNFYRINKSLLVLSGILRWRGTRCRTVQPIFLRSSNICCYKCGVHIYHLRLDGILG